MAYPPTRLQKSLANPVFFNGGAILTPTNEAVVGINDVLLKRLLGEVLTFHADDTGDIKDGSHEDFTSFCSPTHAPVMLLRNLDPIHGHCNGTQMTRLRASARCLEARLNGGDFDGEKRLIYRTKLTGNEEDFPFQLTRLQLPVRIAFAIKINKSQSRRASS